MLNNRNFWFAQMFVLLAFYGVALRASHAGCAASRETIAAGHCRPTPARMLLFTNGCDGFARASPAGPDTGP